MYGNGYGNYGGMQREMASDMWIQQNVPGGLNSAMGRQLDNMFGGNPNPTYGQMYGGYGQGYGQSYGQGYGYQQGHHHGHHHGHHRGGW